MAAPVVSGTVALMLQANPNLTPNLIKAILQYTAQQYPGYKPARQGAGFLNTLGAVRLAKFYATRTRSAIACRCRRSGASHIIWGNHMLTGGFINPTANAWTNDIGLGLRPRRWTMTGDNIVWGTMSDGDNIVWGTADATATTSCGAPSRRRQHRLGHDVDGDNIVWGTATTATTSSGAPTAAAPTATTSCGARADGDNIVWGTADDGDNIVWGTALDGDNIVWGTVATTTTSCGAPRGGDRPVFPR